MLSAINTADDPSVVDFAIKVDTKEEQNNYSSFFNSKNYPSKVNIFYDSITGYENHGDLFNKLADGASGDLFWLFGDDCLIESNNWQSQFANIVGQYPDMIFAINHRHHPWSPVPVVTKKWVETLGYITIGYADTWIQHVALGAERYIQVHEKITVNHYLESCNSPIKKRINKKITKKMSKNYQKAASKIISAINSCQKDIK